MRRNSSGIQTASLRKLHKQILKVKAEGVSVPRSWHPLLGFTEAEFPPGIFARLWRTDSWVGETGARRRGWGGG